MLFLDTGQHQIEIGIERQQRPLPAALRQRQRYACHPVGLDGNVANIHQHRHPALIDIGVGGVLARRTAGHGRSVADLQEKGLVPVLLPQHHLARKRPANHIAQIGVHLACGTILSYTNCKQSTDIQM